jgi:hypothetical protein
MHDPGAPGDPRVGIEGTARPAQAPPQAGENGLTPLWFSNRQATTPIFRDVSCPHFFITFAN